MDVFPVRPGGGFWTSSQCSMSKEIAFQCMLAMCNVFHPLLHFTCHFVNHNSLLFLTPKCKSNGLQCFYEVFETSRGLSLKHSHKSVSLFKVFASDHGFGVSNDGVTFSTMTFLLQNTKKVTASQAWIQWGGWGPWPPKV